MLSNNGIIAGREAEIDKLLMEGTEEEVRDFIYQTRLLAWELNDITYKLLPIVCKPYQPKHMR